MLKVISGNTKSEQRMSHCRQIFKYGTPKRILLKLINNSRVESILEKEIKSSQILHKISKETPY